jgi:hypothetical protein
MCEKREQRLLASLLGKQVYKKEVSSRTYSICTLSQGLGGLRITRDYLELEVMSSRGNVHTAVTVLMRAVG